MKKKRGGIVYKEVSSGETERTKKPNVFEGWRDDRQRDGGKFSVLGSVRVDACGMRIHVDASDAGSACSSEEQLLTQELTPPQVLEEMGGQVRTVAGRREDREVTIYIEYCAPVLYCD